MKKVLLIATIALLGFTANAQVRLGLGAGYAIPMGDIADFTSGGAAVNFEVGYAVTESIDVSLVGQIDFLAGGTASIGGAGISEEVNFGAVAIGSYLLNGRYYFTEEGFRPYASLGLGLASIGSVEAEADTTGVDASDADTSTSNFAIKPAVGFKYGVLNVNIAYLNAGKVEESSASDLSFNIGLLFSIGGK